MASTSISVAVIFITYMATRIYPAYTVAICCLPFAVYLLYAIYQIFIYPFYVSPFRRLPEPQGARFPWAHAFVLRSADFHGFPLRDWVETVVNDGIIRFRVLFNQERLLLTSPEGLKEVLVTKTYEFQKPEQAGFMFRQLLGNGVLIAEGDAHRRKSLLPAFAFRHIKELYPLFWEKARESTEEIVKASRNSTYSPMQSNGNTPQYAYNWASRTTLDIIGQSGIGYDFNAVSNPDGELVTVYRKLFHQEDEPAFRWIALGVQAPLKLLFRLPIPTFRDAKRGAAAIRAFAHTIVQKKRASMKSGHTSDIDIMSVAMSSGQFTDDEVVDQMMTFLAAGHETTASALTWAMWLLCEHTKIQERLRDEIRANLPSIRDRSKAISALQIDKLPYLNAVCNEVLRFIPTVPFTIRDAVVDTTVLGQRIPKGTRIFMSPWATNADTKLWGESAHIFDPDRWLGDGMANSGGAKNNFANLTFLHGPRSCIGKDFAKSEFLCILAAWIGRFEVKPAGGQTLPMNATGWVTSYPRHMMPVVYEEIDGW